MCTAGPLDRPVKRAARHRFLEGLSAEVVAFVQRLRKMDLFKLPGIAETIDWAAALLGLGARNLQDSRELVFETLSCVLKTREDSARVSREVTDRLLGKVA